MKDERIVECKHCNGRGKCNCDECVKVSGVKPSIWENPTVGCCKCHGTGKQKIY